MQPVALAFNGKRAATTFLARPVTYGEQGVDLGRFTEAELVLHHADDEATDDVDEEDLASKNRRLRNEVDGFGTNASQYSISAGDYTIEL